MIISMMCVSYKGKMPKLASKNKANGISARLKSVPLCMVSPMKDESKRFVIGAVKEQESFEVMTSPQN